MNDEQWQPVYCKLAKGTLLVTTGQWPRCQFPLRAHTHTHKRLLLSTYTTWLLAVADRSKGREMEAQAPAAVCNRIKSQWLVDTANLAHLPAYFAY